MAFADGILHPFEDLGNMLRFLCRFDDFACSEARCLLAHEYSLSSGIAIAWTSPCVSSRYFHEVGRWSNPISIVVVNPIPCQNMVFVVQSYQAATHLH